MHWSVGRLLRRTDRWRLARSNFDDTYHINCDTRPTKPPLLDVVTVAFNNRFVVSEQVRLLRKHLVDQFCYTVVDNSSDALTREAIERFCRQQEIPYILCPSIRCSTYDPSSSHGLALNWAWSRYLNPRSARYAAFLDHDVFPRRTTSLVKQLATQPIWGHLQTRGARWYIWPGLCVLDTQWIGLRSLDFTPGPGFDTGGRLYDLMRRELSKEDLIWPAHSRGKLYEGQGIPQDDLYEQIGDWLHTHNASGWLSLADRDQHINALLRTL